MNKARNIKEIAKKWGLSFSAVQRVMSRKKEHSVGGRQYMKRKQMTEKQGGPVKKSQRIKEKEATKSADAEDAPPKEPSSDSSDSMELLDVPWTPT